jgi:hypothetical protein
VSKPKKPKVERCLEKLRRDSEKSIRSVESVVPKRYGNEMKYYYFCPDCFQIGSITVDIGKQPPEKAMCCDRAEAVLIDDRFKVEFRNTLMTFCEKAKRVAEIVSALRESLGSVKDCDARAGWIELHFYRAMILSLRLRGLVFKAYLLVTHLRERDLEGLLRLASILREEGFSVEVEVNCEGCEVPEEKMKSNGFERIREPLGRKLYREKWYFKL